LTRNQVHRLVPVVACVLALSGCGGGGERSVQKAAAVATNTAPSPTAAPTTAAPPPTAPLTGLAADPALMLRPVLVVKIDNVAEAHPQAGINQADVVYEELVENSSTRLMALFQSTDAGPVGPVRSARPTDVLLFTPLRRPLFAWSGANTWVRDMIGNSNIVDVGNTPAVDQYFRESSRAAPHNLFIEGYLSMLASHQEDAGSPQSLFVYRAPDEPLGANARPLGSVNIVWGRFGGNAPVDYAWDAGVGGWFRSQAGVPHVDSDGVQVAPPNVIIQFVDYQPNGGIPDGQLVGQGVAWVLTAGNIVEGTWTKPDAETPTQFLDAAGAPIKLTPGRTWVSLAPPDSATITG
jgi:hypothetical protein